MPSAKIHFMGCSFGRGSDLPALIGRAQVEDMQVRCCVGSSRVPRRAVRPHLVIVGADILWNGLRSRIPTADVPDLRLVSRTSPASRGSGVGCRFGTSDLSIRSGAGQNLRRSHVPDGNR